MSAFRLTVRPLLPNGRPDATHVWVLRRADGSELLRDVAPTIDAAWAGAHAAIAFLERAAPGQHAAEEATEA